MTTEKASSRAPQRFKSFTDLGHAIGRAGGGAERFDFALLRFGSVFWIPDEVSSFGGREGEHPWVVVRPYRLGSVTVAACPRTSQVARNANKGLLLPAGVVDGLDRDGVILLKNRQTFIAADFRDYRYAGNLTREWQHQLRAELDTQAWHIGRESEEP